MDNVTHALVLTGTLLPGHEADRVWPGLAGYFRMDAEKVAGELVPRAPVSIKESTDLAKLQGLQEGLRGIGAESQIHALDERGSVFAVIGGQPRGPMPMALVDARVRAGSWPASTEVASVGSSTWQAYSRLQNVAVNAAAAPPAPPPTPAMVVAYPAADGAMGASPVQPLQPQALNRAVDYGEMIPAGEAIHAGFWRRSAAMMLDGLILIIPLILVNIVPFLGLILTIVGQWLYFALMESSEKQATFGKQAFGLKVCDDYGHRIDFGRATGRYFGKIISNVILGVGFMMAGFTTRKQALHDVIAGCVVVFDTVDADQPMPTQRPPMPWYGWLLNVILVASPFVTAFSIYLVLRNLNWH
ncbi:MAG: RDD family protein [Tahibacter sp.]